MNENDTRGYPYQGYIHPQQGQTTTQGTPFLALFKQCMGSFTSHGVVNNEEMQERANGLSSLSEKTRESNFLLSYLPTLSVGQPRPPPDSRNPYG